MKRTVNVVVAKQQFAVRTDATSSYVQELANFVTSKVEEVRASKRTVTTQSLALLAALNIADELHQLQKSHAVLKRNVRERSKRILSYLENEAGL